LADIVGGLQDVFQLRDFTLIEFALSDRFLLILIRLTRLGYYEKTFATYLAWPQ
jgi:hypothetical protein